MLKKSLILLLPTLLLNSCGIFSPVTLPKINTYAIMLDDSASHDNTCSTMDGKKSLQITRMHANSPFDTNRMIYSSSNFQFADYSYSKWSGMPSSMLTSSIEQYLAQSCLYKSVVSSDFMTTANLRLNTQLIELAHIVPNADDKSANNGASVKLEILVQVVDNASNQVVKSKTFVETAKADATPSSFAAQANTLNRMFLADLAAWLK